MLELEQPFVIYECDLCVSAFVLILGVLFHMEHAQLHLSKVLLFFY